MQRNLWTASSRPALSLGSARGTAGASSGTGGRVLDGWSAQARQSAFAALSRQPRNLQDPAPPRIWRHLADLGSPSPKRFRHGATVRAEPRLPPLPALPDVGRGGDSRNESLSGDECEEALSDYDEDDSADEQLARRLVLINEKDVRRRRRPPEALPSPHSSRHPLADLVHRMRSPQVAASYHRRREGRGLSEALAKSLPASRVALHMGQRSFAYWPSSQHEGSEDEEKDSDIVAAVRPVPALVDRWRGAPKGGVQSPWSAEPSDRGKRKDGGQGDAPEHLLGARRGGRLGCFAGAAQTLPGVVGRVEKPPRQDGDLQRWGRPPASAALFDGPRLGGGRRPTSGEREPFGAGEHRRDFGAKGWMHQAGSPCSTALASPASVPCATANGPLDFGRPPRGRSQGAVIAPPPTWGSSLPEPWDGGAVEESPRSTFPTISRLLPAASFTGNPFRNTAGLRTPQGSAASLPSALRASAESPLGPPLALEYY